MGCNFSEPSVDVSTMPNWDETKVWVIDVIIEGNEAEQNSNFLFQANITADGTIENKAADKDREKSYIVLDNDLYDINTFVEDNDFDGKLSFTLKFGACSARGEVCKNGWQIQFKDLMAIGTKYYCLQVMIVHFINTNLSYLTYFISRHKEF